MLASILHRLIHVTAKCPKVDMQIEKLDTPKALYVRQKIDFLSEKNTLK